MTFLRANFARALAVMATELLLVLGLVACGGSGGGGKPVVPAMGTAAKSSAAGAAFLQAMVPHHLSAIDMAQIARSRGEHPQIKTLANAIVKTQTTEITKMERLYGQLFDKPLKPDQGAHEALGLSAGQAGMAPMKMSSLERAKPFDKAFIDQMIPHHRGAVRMARAAMARSIDNDLRRLAGAIIVAESKEIAELNAWRTKWYG